MRGIRALGFHGVKIGEPFHETVIEHRRLSSRKPRNACGSVNLITTEGDRLIGDNTEGARPGGADSSNHHSRWPAGNDRRRRPRRASDRRRAWPMPASPPSPWPAARPTRAANLSSSSKSKPAAGFAHRTKRRHDRGRTGRRRACQRHVARHGRCRCKTAARSQLVRFQDGRGRRRLQHLAHVAHAASGRTRLPHHRRPGDCTSNKPPSPCAPGPASYQTRSRCAKQRKNFLGI